MRREKAMSLISEGGANGASALARAFVEIHSMSDYEIVVGRDTADPTGGDDEHWVVILIRKDMINNNQCQRNRPEVIGGAYVITENGVPNIPLSAFVSPTGIWTCYRG